MGDRGNIIVDGVYLYSHWTGSKLPETLKSALNRKLRWDDSSYLTRMIFCEMVKDDIDGEIGFGISKTKGDGGVDITVDTQAQIIRYGKKIYTFEGYIELENANKELLGDDDK